MIRTTVWLTEQARAWLTKESKRTGLKPAEIIRRALDEYREKKDGGR